MVLVVKNLPANAGDTRDPGSIPGLRRSPGVEMATCSSIFAWKIPWAEEPVRLQFMGLQRVRHDWVECTHQMSRWLLSDIWQKVLEGAAGMSEIYPVTENGVLRDHHEINVVSVKRRQRGSLWQNWRQRNSCRHIELQACSLWRAWCSKTSAGHAFLSVLQTHLSLLPYYIYPGRLWGN